MQLFARNLSTLGFAQGFTHWHYRADPGEFHLFLDSLAFSSLAGLIKQGDLITLSAGKDGGMFYVAEMISTDTIRRAVTKLMTSTIGAFPNS